MLERIHKASLIEKFPDSQGAVDKLITSQVKMLEELEVKRSTILGLLQKGKDLSRDLIAPAFLKEEVAGLEDTWNSCYEAANGTLRKLKETQKVWENYNAQKQVICKLMEDAEEEIQKLVPKHNHKAIQKDLSANKKMRDDIKSATDDLMIKMKELSETLATVASKDQQDEFAKDIHELEERLNELLSACDEKIKNLEHLNIKWNNFNKNLEVMKTFIDGAKKNLNQITSLDMSPEDRLRMTKELQNQVKARMSTLDDLERDAQYLFNDSANVSEVQAMKIEIENVKLDVSTLHHDVDEQSTKVSEDIHYWQNYKKCISEVKPWLETAEVKISAGLSKFTNLEEVKEELKKIQLFNSESKDVKVKIDEIKKMSILIACKTNASDEVDALKSRHEAAQNISMQWLTSIENLVESWNKFNNLKDQLQSWVNDKEKLMAREIDVTNPNLKALATDLEAIKEVLQEASQKQAILINLTKEGDTVSRNLSQEGSGKIRNEISMLKSTINQLAENAQKQIEKISSAINEKQVFQTQLDDYNTWMEEVLLRIDELNEIPVEKLDELKERTLILAQEVADKKTLLDKMQREVEKSKGSDKGEEFNIQFNAIVRQHSSAAKLLEEKHTCLFRWSAFLNWHNESSSHLKYIQQTIDSHQSTGKELDTVLSELENIAVQCQTRKLEGADDEETSVRSNTFVLDKETNKPMSILLLVADILQKIVLLKKAIEDKKGHQTDIETKWQEFRQTEQRIADWLQVVLSKVQKISVKKSNLESLENAATAVTSLLQENKEKVEVKNIYNDVGRYLMTHDTAKMKAIQEALTEAENKWRKITNLLTEQQSKSQTLISMWKQCIENKNLVSARLEESSDILNMINDSVAQSYNEAASYLDKSKEAVSILKKTRQPFEAFYKRQSHLISELNTVPGFDTSPLKKELSQVQQKFGFLGESLTKKIANIDSILVMWKQIEQSREEITTWTEDTKNNLKGALENLSDTELAKIKLEKYKSDVNQYTSIRAALDQKILKLKQLNNEKEVTSAPAIISKLDNDLAEIEGMAADLESAIGNLGESANTIKEEMKSITGKLTIIREGIMKCEDVSMISDEQLLERLSVIQLLQVDLSQFDEKILEIVDRIKELQQECSSNDVKNLQREYAVLQKKFDNVNNQAIKLTNSIHGILEKHYLNKVTDFTKSNASFSEKISWCLPDPSSDRYSIECKLDALMEIEKNLVAMKPGLTDIETCGNVIKKIVDEEKQLDIETTMNLLNEQLTVIETDIKKFKLILQHSFEILNNFDQASDSFSMWMKETEDKIRQLTSSHVNLETFEKELLLVKKAEEDMKNHEDDLKNLLNLSQTIKEECPESKTEQIANTLKSRFESAISTLNKHSEKLKGVFQSNDLQKDTIESYEKWLKNSKEQLEGYENISSGISSAEINKFKLIMADKENGSVLLEKAIETAENIFSQIAPKDREKIRNEIRSLRDGWENHIDYMISLSKAFDSVILEKSTFTERLKQVCNWYENVECYMIKDIELGSNLAHKKTILGNSKSLLQDINTNILNINSLIENKKQFEDDMMSKLSSIHDNVKKLEAKIEKDVQIATDYVTEHEEYNDKFEETKDFISSLTIELSSLVDSHFEAQDTENRIEDANKLLSKREDGSTLISCCEEIYDKISCHTTEEGKNILKKELQEVAMLWSRFLKNVEAFKEQQEKLSMKFGTFRTDLEKIIKWLQEMELKVKDQPMQKDAASKDLHSQKLAELYKIIEDKKQDIESVTSKCCDIQSDAELSNQVSQIGHKYASIKKHMKETIKKFNSYASEHKIFDHTYEEFLSWINNLSSEMNKHTEIVGDLRILQERRNNIEDIEDQRSDASVKYDSLIEQAEKLYSHTSPDGKEIIRQKISELNLKWEQLAQIIEMNSNKIDTCLNQFSEFSSAQEQLTKWLKEIEQHMQLHTELRPSIQEKKAQFQNHKIVHQEVTSHNSLVETVCSRAHELVLQTKDNSLNVYIDSIRNLFKNIGEKSKDLMDKLEISVNDHNQYLALVSGFADFVSNQSDLLSQCGEVTGEKNDLERKRQILDDLKENRTEGDERIQELEIVLEKVLQSTSKRGCEKLKVEMAEIKESWRTHVAVMEDVDMNIQKALAHWDQFDEDLTKHHEWFKQFENIFRNPVVLANASEKQEQLEEYENKRSLIIEHEKIIDDFVNNSHNLLHNSGVERLKPVITQISNRYQLLHVLSKEVVSKWQSIAEDHIKYDEKLKDINLWLDSLESTVQDVKSEKNIEKKMNELKKIISCKENASIKFSNFTATGEGLFPDTNSNGRENIRQEIKLVKDRWDELLKYVHDQQKRHDIQLQHWSSYQDSLIQLTSWLDSMENIIKLDHVNWLNVSDVKAKLTKMKNCQQDISSHKRFIENINERAAAVISMNPNAPSEEIKEMLDLINERYHNLKDNMNSTLSNLDDAVEVIQQYHDLQRTHQDWQKLMWDKLTVYTDYSGSKQALESRLENINEMLQEQTEGENVLNKIEKHIDSIDGEKIPSNVQESMKRDISNIKFDFSKFSSSIEEVKQGLNDRLRQWVEYDSQLEKLSSWLGDTETQLKNYTYKASLEEKSVQLEKYKVKLILLKFFLFY